MQTVRINDVRGFSVTYQVELAAMLKGFPCRLVFRLLKIENGKATVVLDAEDEQGKPFFGFATAEIEPGSSVTFGLTYGIPRLNETLDITADLVFDPDTVEIGIRSPEAH